MKVFGTIYPFVERDEASFKIGRHVANFDFLRALLKWSHFDEFHFFCMTPDHAAWTWKRIDREDLHHEQKRKVRIFLYQNLLKEIRVNDYYVFHLGGWGYFYSGLAHLRNRYAKTPFPITGIIHSLNGIETNFHAMKMCMAPLYPYDSIICTSNAGREVLRRTFEIISRSIADCCQARLVFKGRMDIIPLGVDNDFAVSSGRDDAREYLSVPRDAFVGLVLGRFSPKTKMDLFPLLQTHKRLTEEESRRPRWLIIAGSGSQKEVRLVKDMIAELRIESTTILVSNFEDSFKSKLYAASDVYISLSDNIQETFGISVIEAMLSGLPSVVTDIDGYKELIEDGVHGLKVPTIWVDKLEMAELAEIQDFDTMQLFLAQCMAADTEALYEHLKTLSDHPDKAREMGSKASSRASEMYLWSKVMGQYEELWDELYELSKACSPLPKTENPFVNRYLSTFAHYPTKTISGGLFCTVTAAGAVVSKRGVLPSMYSELKNVVEPVFVFETLGKLLESPKQVGELTKSRTKIEGDVAQYNLLWMAKYGLITIREL